MIITVNAITIANKSDWTQYLIANAAASDTTTDECTEGIHPLPNALEALHFHDESFTIIPFAKTASIKETTGTDMMLS